MATKFTGFFPTLQNFAIPPQEKMTKLGWKIYANFFKVKQNEKLSMLSQKKKWQTQQISWGNVLLSFVLRACPKSTLGQY